MQGRHRTGLNHQFVADTVDPPSLRFGATSAIKSEQPEFAGVVKNFQTPATPLRGGFDVMQDGADINCLAVVAAVIFAELLHAKNFTQKCGGAKKFLNLGFVQGNHE